MVDVDLSETLKRLAETAHKSELRDAKRIYQLTTGYLLPRLSNRSAPPLIAVVGSTGSGKSTLVGSLAGREISKIGVIRPTTERAVVWCHREQGDRYLSTADEVEIVGDVDPLLKEVTLVDTPDLDSRFPENRERTWDLLSKSDGAVLVTTPQRYADLVPMAVAIEIDARRLPCVVVMNRLSSDRGAAVTDMVQLWRDQGLGLVQSTRDVVAVYEQRTRDRILPPVAVARLRTRIARLGRPESMVKAFAGTLRRVLDLAYEVSEADASVRDQLTKVLSEVEESLSG